MLVDIRKFNMSDDVQRDAYGVPVDPGHRYQEFMLSLHDIVAEASDAGYSNEALELLRKARLMFIAEFERQYPGYGKGRALWK